MYEAICATFEKNSRDVLFVSHPLFFSTHNIFPSSDLSCSVISSIGIGPSMGMSFSCPRIVELLFALTLENFLTSLLKRLKVFT